ncbi:hypothetical protein KJ632_05840, partial [Patescibacteria group bacterium]|nr:hypothetical protein [Patescibacteria group bacterium]
EFLGAVMEVKFSRSIKMVPLGWLVRLRPDTLGNRPVRTRMPGGVGGRGIKTPFLSLFAFLQLF